MTSISSPMAGPTSHMKASGGLAVALLAISAFIIVTTEFIIVGLLPALARDLNISVTSAGWLVTLFAFTVMLFGPILTGLVSHFDRKRLFVVLLLVFAGSNGLAAISTNIWVLGLARFLPAIALPVFWGTASETAAQIAGPERSAKAVANVYMGIAGAMVFGIPLGTLAGEAFGWRGTFGGLALLSLVMAGLLVRIMPTTTRPARVEFAAQYRIFKDPAFIGNLVLSVLVFTAMFTSYTYLADFLERAAGIASAAIGWWLMGFGVVGLAGNWLGGHMVSRDPIWATAIVLVILTIGMAATALLSGNHALLMVALAVWGLANTAVYPISQVRVMRAASHAQALAGTLNVSMANAGIGLGAIIGGAAIPIVGIANIGYVAAVVAILALVVTPLVAALNGRGGVQ